MPEEGLKEKEIKSIEETIRVLMQRFINEHPDLPLNYTKMILLYWREIDELEIPDEWLHLPPGVITNPWSIGRLFARVKKDFYDDVDKKISKDQEEMWARLMAEEKEIDAVINGPKLEFHLPKNYLDEEEDPCQ